MAQLQQKKTSSPRQVNAQHTHDSSGAQTAGMKKEYLKSRPACKVTFRMSGSSAPDARQVCVAGDFNQWDTRALPMKRLKNGDYTAQIELPTGREYQFRYCIDDVRWENERHADRYVPTPFGDGENSVVVV